MRTIRVNLEKMENKSYDIVVGRDLFLQIATDLKKMNLANRYVILSDSNVEKNHGKKLLGEMQKQGLDVSLLVFNAGEKSKSRQTKAEIEDMLFEQGYGRDSALIAIGGGVCGDLGGFIAATYMRGIPIVQVATSIVAQADSSVGGKTAIDVPAGKNLIGTFHQPSKVYIDIATLDTLPEMEYRAGMVELVKHGIIADRAFLEFFEKNQNTIMERKGETYTETMIELLEWNCKIKTKVVEEDERENGIRKILNYGHTIGHAIEKMSDFKLKHGECVAIGLITEAKIAHKMNFLPKEDVERQQKIFKGMGLSTLVPKKMETEEILRLIRLDKKARLGKAEFALPATIGEMKKVDGKYGIKVLEETVKQAIKENR